MKVCSYQDRLNELFDADSRSLTAIAKELGVSKQAISMWRSGERSPKKSVLVKIADMYHVDISWLMGFDVERDGKRTREVIIPDSDLFRKLIVGMEPKDYETVMAILEKTEKAMRERGEL